MKICLIIDDYLPRSIKVGAKMMHELACELNHQGHKVTVVTPDPFITQNYVKERLNEINIYRFKSQKIKNINKFSRTISETLLSFYAWKHLKHEFHNNHHELIVYYSPTIFWGSLVKKLKKLWTAKSYLILRDFFPQWAIDQKLMKEGSLIEKYFRFFEHKSYMVADTIGIMSKANLALFNQKNPSLTDRTEVLYNWAKNDPITKGSTFYRDKYKLHNKVVYFYGGNIGLAQDMMNIVRLAKKLQAEPKAFFFLVGAGDEYNKISKAIDQYDLKNILLLGPVSQDEFKIMLSEFDVGLFTLHQEHTTHNFPGKLLGYMVEGLPILGSINAGNDLKEILDNYNAGLTSINPDDELFYEHAKQLLDKNYRRAIGKINAQKLLNEKFSVLSISKQILAFSKEKDIPYTSHSEQIKIAG
ncbi:MAG: Putative glycosyltransferase [uncultured Sulfurovum sp.]|uniref:Glycosyltransferase n=1 Tax=uncultured Sulfurovum sp. TaxID=269237 RepID=A0A6S6SMW0_9BACT|nr:MAG: Putative glycosyltransferase [uncultured Sulfurovum sp.]